METKSAYTHHIHSELKFNDELLHKTDCQFKKLSTSFNVNFVGIDSKLNDGK